MTHHINHEALLEIFNTIIKGEWTKEYRKEFLNQYQAMIVSTTKPILNKVDNSDLRKSIRVIKAENTRPPSAITICVGYGKLEIGKVTKESIDSMIEDIYNQIIDKEQAWINTLKGDVTMTILEEFTFHSDPTLIKTCHLGMFGWETIVLTDTDIVRELIAEAKDV